MANKATIVFPAPVGADKRKLSFELKVLWKVYDWISLRNSRSKREFWKIIGS